MGETMKTTNVTTLSPKSRAYLQRLNLTRGILRRDKETGRWYLNGEEVSIRPAEELLFLCCLSTVADLGYEIRYTVSDEGRRILTERDYEPIILRRHKTTA